MKNLREDIRAAFLGATGGLFSFSVFLLVARVDDYYKFLSCLQNDPYGEFCRNVANLHWMPICFWHLVLSVVASLMVYRYLPVLRNTPFLLWQIVGITTLFGWLLSFCLFIGLDCLMSGHIGAVERALTFAKFGDLAKYVSVGLSCNVLFGSAMLASSTRYVAEDPR